MDKEQEKENVTSDNVTRQHSISCWISKFGQAHITLDIVMFAKYIYLIVEYPIRDELFGNICLQHVKK